MPVVDHVFEYLAMKAAAKIRSDIAAILRESREGKRIVVQRLFGSVPIVCYRFPCSLWLKPHSAEATDRFVTVLIDSPPSSCHTSDWKRFHKTTN
jgi:hypothetical protein